VGQEPDKEKESKMADIHFGTDGWRGRIAEDYTFDNVRRCAQGFASYLLARGNRDARVVVGHDKRFAAEYFAAAAAEVMVGNGFQVWLTDGSAPTPVISYSIVEREAIAGINITASHNPPWDCGLKVRDQSGAAVAPDGLAEIESLIPPIGNVKRIEFEKARSEGKIEVWDPAPAYLAHIGTLVEIEPIREAGLDILVEPMWGNGIGWFPRILREIRFSRR
jgi:phosphomannomutase